MEPPPPPISGRFRLRVQIYRPQDAHNLSAAPLQRFTIVKTQTLPLPDLTLQQICDEVVKRFKAIYPSEELFAIDNTQDSFGSDLYLGYHVREVFEDNEIFRVIKGSSYRASVEPHRARSSSAQPNSFMGDRKRYVSHTDGLWDTEKRRRTFDVDPDQPLQSKEPNTVELVVGSPIKDSLNNAKTKDSKAVAINHRQSSQNKGIAQVGPLASKANQTKLVEGIEDRLTDRYSPNLVTNSATTHRHINSPLSAGSSSRDDIRTSGSDAQKATSGLKRKRVFIDEPDDQHRLRSISTAMTTPLSVIQKVDEQSPMNDLKRLKRPSFGTIGTKSETYRPTKQPPRRDIYEAIETDYEDYNAEPIEQNGTATITAPVGVSLAKFRFRSSNTPSSDNATSSQRINASSERQRAGNMEQQRRERGEQIRLKEGRSRGDTLGKQQLDVGQQRSTREDSEERRLAQERDKRDRLTKVDIDRTRREKRLWEEAATRREFEQEVNENGDAQVQGRAQPAAAAIEAECGKTIQVGRPADGEARRRTEVSAAEKRVERSNLYEQELIQPRYENMGYLKGTKAIFRESAPPPKGMLSRAVAEYDSNLATKTPSRESTSAPASSSAHVSTGSKKTSFTPLLSRGRSSGLSPTVTFSSQAVGGSSHKTLSPNVGLEAQMPLPPRRLSYVETPTSTSRRSVSTGATMKQTTLVPPRLGINHVKITPKSALPKETTGGFRPSNSSLKGKAKAVESPGKPPPAIVISDDEEANSDSTEVYKYAIFENARPASSAHHNGDPPQLTRHIKSGQVVENSKSAISAKQKSISPHMSPDNSTTTNLGVISATSHIETVSQINACVTDSNSHKQPVSLPISNRVSPEKVSQNESQSGSSTKNHSSVQVIVSLASKDGPQEALVFQGNIASDEEGSGSNNQDSGNSSDEHSEEDSNEISDNQAEDVDNLKDKSKDPRQGPKPRSDDSERMLDAESEGERSDETDQSDTDDEEHDSESEQDTTQEQLDSQLTQSSQSLPTLRQQPFRQDRNNVSPNQDMEAIDHRSKMPSLRRLVQEVKRTIPINLEASKARSLAIAQQAKDDAVDSSELDDSSDAGSATDENSNASEDAAEASDHEGAKIRKELSSKIDELGQNSSPLPETHVPAVQPTYPRKETRILPPPKHNPQRQDKKIGFGKLARQFNPRRP